MERSLDDRDERLDRADRIGPPAVSVAQRDPCRIRRLGARTTIASYVLLLGFGMQTAVGRFVALAHGPQAASDKQAVVVAGFHLSFAAACLGIALAAVAALVAPHFLTDLPPDLVADFRIALALCGGSAAMGLIGMPFTGIFLGEQRAHIPASILLAGRLAQCALLVFAAVRFGSLPALAVAFVGGQFAILAAQLAVWRRDSGARARRCCSCGAQRCIGTSRRSARRSCCGTSWPPSASAAT